jgi:hypothetical protein
MDYVQPEMLASYHVEFLYNGASGFQSSTCTPTTDTVFNPNGDGDDGTGCAS